MPARDVRMLHALPVWSFGSWLAATSLSRLFQDVLWIIPVSQCIHIVCISILFGSALAINLRLLGWWFLDRRPSELARNLLPWMWGAFVVIAITGFVQTAAEPVREFQSPFFWAKMAFIAVVVLLTAVFAGSLRASGERWDAADSRPAALRTFAVVSSLLWIGIIVFGRLIAYTWILPQT